jgi:hypothetical protein
MRLFDRRAVKHFDRATQLIVTAGRVTARLRGFPMPEAKPRPGDMREAVLPALDRGGVENAVHRSACGKIFQRRSALEVFDEDFADAAGEGRRGDG